ncbi:RND family efflux transporter, MFP subunit [Candidatus Kryptobacter tengchongensis]|nr:efflux RND transporter periplasmic adaptor subunit [Candidatus Kryptobacter tengchongensis]CUS92560.1 RND family efflux transporter, MFP subunit [Candidatus Kryptobacter tengchongensis]CUU06167.1 RND family efflux transporter, MFP subunit [Candidatus Kryptobacter tengchongensis]
MVGKISLKRFLIFVGIFIICGVILTLGLILSGGSDEEIATLKEVETGEIIFPVKVDVARKGDLIQWISAGGLAKPAREIDIIPRVSGQIVNLNVYNGKFITEGELILKIDDTEFKMALKQAENNLLDARVEYNLMKLGIVPGSVNPERFRREIDSLRVIYEDMKKKFEMGQISEVELERVKRDYEALLVYSDVNREDVIANKSGLNRALIEFERAKLNLSYTEIKAPFSGYIADCELTPGGYVTAGQKCMKLVDISKVRIISELTEMQVAKISPGNIAEVEFVAYPGKIFKGKVVEINPYIDIERRLGKVIIEVENPEHKIKPGMFGTVRIQSEVYKNVLIIPRRAVVMRDNRPVVFVYQGDGKDQGRSKWFYVELGRENEQFYEIKSGISPGDTIIVEGNYNLAHDSKVRIIK